LYFTLFKQPGQVVEVGTEILALSPWIINDPVKTTPEMSLAERRATLTNVARQRLTGGTHAHHYPESAIWADVEVPAAPVEISDL
jgi:hypothetical protein